MTSRRVRQSWAAVFWINLLVLSMLLILVAAGGEIYLRLTKPFVRPHWVSRFDPELGFTFEPGALIRHTNHVDFWLEERVNSWGFLDHEPPAAPAKDGVCRIAFVGDSFVEAAQVKNDEKFHRLLEKYWNTRKDHGLSLETFALGYSGTGQANQLPWVKLLRPLSPRLIVLVFVNNDFANNNVWLEAARNGWHPDHPPRPFLVRGEMKPADPAWRDYLLPGQNGNAQAAWDIERAGIAGWLHQKLWQRSYLYSFLFTLWVRHAYDASAYYANVPAAVAVLRTMPGGQQMFGDWTPPDDLTLDQMFAAERMPPVFDEALKDTAQTLRAWKKVAEEMGAQIVLLATHSLRMQYLTPNPSAARKRPWDAELPMRRLRAIAQAEGIPLVDQGDFILRSGGSLRDASFRFDGHWSPYGHETAAKAMVQWLQSHSNVCSARQPQKDSGREPPFRS